MSPLKTELPKYTLAQELSNSITHGLGTVLTLIFGPFLILKAINSGNVWAIVSCSIFILSLLLCYTTSCVYHALGRNNGKRVLRVLDHNMIYVLITGTYAPYCLVSIMSVSPMWAWIIYGGCVALGAVGISLNSVNLKKFRIFCMIDYICMGWLIVISFWPLLEAIGWFPAFFLLLMGGVAYTLGAVLYGIGHKNAWFHLVFHCFCLVGTALMFIPIYFFVV